ncbi:MULTISPECIES: lysophospholipid acyltransferase family protein [unclassified Fibrobacter]|uniref:lysophospholipid acyltransferase family protein n=1 Tax=unclassified Fibrobacter TaxID=2634177 RepID=UPI000D6BD85C|nr:MULTISPECIES: lysophospholipid acyltransferase family protein [unclassified Fibrobacter]PWJ63379.1 KDO2-lipid IV(A) lauroyltransferase [Fibrobacter sp. UWR4]PZW68314.1 KDO2-lipid IV(A) lauroyltransferase [Fibrobacter sp. UWR1]
MSLLGQISARIFASAAYAVLLTCGWKKKTVEANLKYVQDVMLKQVQHDPQQNRNLYKRMLKNLTRHVGELLFCFDTYKKLPENCDQYPCKVGGKSFELAEGAATTIGKMRRGGIFLTAHYGNYEASGAWLCALGVPLKASFIPLKPAWLNRYVYEKVRCVRGRPYSIDAKTPREFLNLLDGNAPDCNGQKQLFCLLADQDSRIGSALDGTFLGCKVRHNPVPDFLLKHRPDTPVFFCWIEERGSRKILHALESETNPQDSVISAADADLRQHDHNHPENAHGSIIDGAYRNWLEERIQENPALWYGWTHRRFRSKNPEIYR